MGEGSTHDSGKRNSSVVGTEARHGELMGTETVICSYRVGLEVRRHDWRATSCETVATSGWRGGAATLRWGAMPEAGVGWGQSGRGCGRSFRREGVGSERQRRFGGEDG